tara:strand:+ start:1549 stop:1821 length:273 start_codon:yes stop_codon:yes gene_type:complete
MQKDKNIPNCESSLLSSSFDSKYKPVFDSILDYLRKHDVLDDTPLVHIELLITAIQDTTEYEEGSLSQTLLEMLFDFWEVQGYDYILIRN